LEIEVKEVKEEELDPLLEESLVDNVEYGAVVIVLL
jgi:hypothetical protein